LGFERGDKGDNWVMASNSKSGRIGFHTRTLREFHFKNNSIFSLINFIIIFFNTIAMSLNRPISLDFSSHNQYGTKNKYKLIKRENKQ